ncbi:response regulator [Aeromonas jandaei]|uniref:response regulator n=1 Tax=Aeromonas jandaei TaxID=650 RepID=UPI0011175A9F|nr:DNA-binding response regulator [Aeromonas jandaei]
MRLLLAEDNHELAHWLSRALTSAGFAVDWVADGARADHLLRHEKYALAVLDIEMPKLDGLAVLGRLRNRGQGLPVLLLTARGAVEERICGLNAGADDYLAKPFDLGELDARLALTPREQALLTALMYRHWRPVAKGQLFEQVFNLDDEVGLDSIDLYIHRLRKKLVGSGVVITTLRGLGYLLEAAPEASH